VFVYYLVIVSVIVHLLFAKQEKYSASKRVKVVERAPNSKIAVIRGCVSVLIVSFTFVQADYNDSPVSPNPKWPFTIIIKYDTNLCTFQAIIIPLVLTMSIVNVGLSDVVNIDANMWAHELYRYKELLSN